jgi:putative Mg2+ transporter-C (MgtC) family protein
VTPDLERLGEVALAMVLGGLIGAERELADKPAGLRTHMLIAGAAALLVGLSDVMIHRFSAGGEAIRSDSLRVIEAVVTAVGFLGAGMIIRRHSEHVEGLTTAASLRGAKLIENRIRRARRGRTTNPI